jgi:hypothetical protein
MQDYHTFDNSTMFPHAISRCMCAKSAWNRCSSSFHFQIMGLALFGLAPRWILPGTLHGQGFALKVLTLLIHQLVTCGFSCRSLTTYLLGACSGCDRHVRIVNKTNYLHVRVLWAEWMSLDLVSTTHSCPFRWLGNRNMTMSSQISTANTSKIWQSK